MISRLNFSLIFSFIKANRVIPVRLKGEFCLLPLIYIVTLKVFIEYDHNTSIASLDFLFSRLHKFSSLHLSAHLTSSNLCTIFTALLGIFLYSSKTMGAKIAHSTLDAVTLGICRGAILPPVVYT